MKPEPGLGLALSWSRITSVFLVDAAVLVLARHFPGVPQTVAWWVGVAVAAVVTIALVLAYPRITLVSALARWVWGWSTDSAATLSSGCTPAIDHRRRFGRDVIGVSEYQGQLVAVIAVDEKADVLSGRHHDEMVAPATFAGGGGRCSAAAV
jgi:type VII secretion protein EccE